MRLYLSSYRIGENRGALPRLVGGRRQAAIILNALDLYSGDRAASFKRENHDLKSLGFTCEELDLRNYFGTPSDLEARLSNYDLVWVVGGNTFVLARAMAQSHFSAAIHGRLMADDVVYAGFSAGICVTGPDLDGCHLMDDPSEIPQGYDPTVEATPLGWIPWRIVPHFRSDHSEAPLAELAVKHLVDASLPFQTLRDGQVVVIDGSNYYLV